MRLEHELEPRRGRTAVVAASVQLAEGTNPIVEAPPRALEIVATLDGTASLGDVVQKSADRLELTETQTSKLRREVLEVSRELLELGALKFL